MIGPEECQRIAAWSKSVFPYGSARIVVDHHRPAGEPSITEEPPVVYVHPDDFLALRRWADSQPIWAPEETDR